MLRWVIALLCACFVLAFGASAHVTTVHGMPNSHAIHNMQQHSVYAVASAYALHELRESNDTSHSNVLPESPSGGALLLLVLDDLVVDMPDLLNPPAMLRVDDALRVRLMNTRALAPPSPSLKRHPKPPRAAALLA